MDLVRRRLAKAERYAVDVPEPVLSAREDRIAMPLAVPDKRTIERRAEAFARTYAQFPGAARFARHWRRALEAAPGLRRDPFGRRAPVQTQSITPSILDICWLQIHNRNENY